MKHMVLILLLIVVDFFPIDSGKVPDLTRDDYIIIIARLSEFNDDLFREYLHIKVDHPDVVYAQAVLETGWFTSELFTKYNNLFGMKLPRVRHTLAVGTAMGHARYRHWTDAVDDYALWQDYWRSLGYDLTDYYDFLESLCDGGGYSKNPARYNMILRKIGLMV